MNDVVSRRTVKSISCGFYTSEQYSEIVKLLNEVASASYNMMQRNNYNKNCTPRSFCSLKDSTEYDGLPDRSTEYLSNQDSSSHIMEIVTNAKHKARTMVDASVLNTSERLYPPAGVPQILEQAVESLQPRCSQNLPVYRDIEKCLVYIKTQMSSLVETPNTISV